MDFSNLLLDAGMIAIAALSVFLIVKLLAAPIRGLIKFLLHAALGLAILLAVNFIGGYFGFFIPINWITALVAGIGGIPGVVLLVLVYLIIL